MGLLYLLLTAQTVCIRHGTGDMLVRNVLKYNVPLWLIQNFVKPRNKSVITICTGFVFFFDSCFEMYLVDLKLKFF
jgi:hypothetical protein